jgi:hypothetical protein
MVNVFSLLIGSGLLLLGRKLFWFLSGAVGFLIGIEIARRITFPSELTLLVSALALGLVFALMAVFLESVLIIVVGFLGGGLTLIRVTGILGWESPLGDVVAFVVGGVLGAILIVWLFNTALITISSLSGASLIVSGLPIQAPERPLIFWALAILGILIQAIALSREPPPPKKQPPLQP